MRRKDVHRSLKPAHNPEVGGSNPPPLFGDPTGTCSKCESLLFCAETFARLGLHASHYWLYPAGNDDGTEYPLYKAYAGLRDHMGDTLLSSYGVGSNRVYNTRNSKTGELDVWGMNFENATDSSVSLALQ